MSTGLQPHLLSIFSRLKPLHGCPGGWVLTAASCLRRLGRVGRNRTRPSPTTGPFDSAPADCPALRRGCGLRALGAEFLPASKGNPLGAPDGFSRLKNIRTLVENTAAVVRKTPRTVSSDRKMAGHPRKQYRRRFCNFLKRQAIRPVLSPCPFFWGFFAALTPPGP